MAPVKEDIILIHLTTGMEDIIRFGTIPQCMSASVIDPTGLGTVDTLSVRIAVILGVVDLTVDVAVR
jgi:hypothetical protein